MIVISCLFETQLDKDFNVIKSNVTVDIICEIFCIILLVMTFFVRDEQRLSIGSLGLFEEEQQQDAEELER